MLRATGIFPCAILMMVIAACVSDPAEDLVETEQAVSATDPAAAGCSVVTTCNAPGPDGTRCRQQGCSVGAAVLECELESFVVCGAAVCPVIFIGLDGTRQNLCRG